jgi:hypothetical protein
MIVRKTPPKLKKGMMVESHEGILYEVMEVSDDYSEVEQFDDGRCAEDMEEYLPYDDAIYVVARAENGSFTVFCCSRDSMILGD